MLERCRAAEGRIPERSTPPSRAAARWNPSALLFPNPESYLNGHVGRLLAVLALAAALPIPVAAQAAPEGIPLDENLAARLAAFGVPADSTRVLGRSGITPGLDALLVEVGREFAPRARILSAVPDDPGAPWEIGRVGGHWERVTIDAVAPTDVILRCTDTYLQALA